MSETILIEYLSQKGEVFILKNETEINEKVVYAKLKNRHNRIFNF